MPTRRPTLLPCRSAGGYAVTALVVVCSLLSANTASAADYTWSGGGSSSDWSEGANWIGGSAPTAGESIGTLTLPLLPSFQDLENNVNGLSVNQMAVDDSHAYDLMGDALALGSGGLSVVSAAEDGVGQLSVFAPLTLSSSQTWQVAGLKDGWWQQIGLVSSLTGEGSNLTINLSDPTLLTFGARGPSTANDELGTVAINGTSYCTRTPLGEVDGHESYEEICYSSLVKLEAVAVNASDGHSLHLHDVELENYETATGPISATESDLTLGGTGTGPLTLTSSLLVPHDILDLPSLSLDAGSTVKPDMAVQGNTPGTDYGQVMATGAVALGGATLEPLGEPASNGAPCQAPNVGEVDTLVLTTGNLSGQFGNAPEGGTITVVCPPPNEPVQVYSYRINYHTSGEPQTVTATALPAVPTNGELPTIAGTATAGQTLTLTHGFWTNQPSGWSDQWQRCDSSGESCQPIAGATGQSYTLTASNVGSTIRVQETASNAEGTSEPVESEVTAVVQAQAVSGGGGSASGGTTSGGSSTDGSASTGSGRGATAIISSARVAALLQKQLTPTGRAAKIGALLKAGGLTIPFTALEAGTLTVGWYKVPAGTKLARKTKAKPVLVASGRMTFSAPGTGKVKIRLTATGRKLLKSAKTVKLAAKGVFASGGKASINVTKAFVLRA